MEDSVKTPLFVEFYGLPGSGKSTLSHIVAERLRGEGYTVDEPSYDTDHQHPLPKRLKKIIVGAYWFAFHHAQYCCAKIIVQQNGYTGMGAFKQIVNVIKKMRIYDSRKASEIVIMDQGVVQAAISLSMYGKVKAHDNLKRLLSLMPNAAEALRVYIDVDIETAIARMNDRITNDSRVEKLKDQNLKVEMLLRINEETASVRKKYCGNNEFAIVSTNNIVKDADDTYKIIKHKL